ncbi:cupin domain-containing protein [Methylobacterium radiotolerans]|jgi:oxalate decarboxylase|uniref:cupin domain-containing protein n=1 Tax=Methylobacterium radiotolerans TaxID=31998 RepID=UPI0038CF4481
MESSRRHFLGAGALAAGGMAAFATAARAGSPIVSGDHAAKGAGGFGRQVESLGRGADVAYHNPKDVAGIAPFTHFLDGGAPKVTTGGWAKETTIEQLPLAKGIAAVHMFLEPGASRELHWHAIAAEWAFVIDGRCQTVVLDPDGNSEINNYEPGDLWFFPKGHGHSIQTIGDKPCHFILNFDNGGFSEHGTFSITDWINVSPKEMVAMDFGLPKEMLDAFPKGETYIQAGPVVPISQAVEAPWPRASTHKFRLLRDKSAVRDFDGGSFHLVTQDEWPIQTTMSGGLMVIKPGEMRRFHWNTNADEFQYYLSGKGQVARFNSGGRSLVADVGPGMSAYIPMGDGHAIINTGNEPLEIVQTWNAGKFAEIDLDRWIETAPNYLRTNNFTGVPQSTLDKIRRT